MMHRIKIKKCDFNSNNFYVNEKNPSQPEQLFFSYRKKPLPFKIAFENMKKLGIEVDKELEETMNSVSTNTKQPQDKLEEIELEKQKEEPYQKVIEEEEKAKTVAATVKPEKRTLVDEKKHLCLLRFINGVGSAGFFTASAFFTGLCLMTLTHLIVQGVAASQAIEKIIEILKSKGYNIDDKTVALLTKITNKIRNTRWLNFMRAHDKFALAALITEICVCFVCGVSAVASFIFACILAIMYYKEYKKYKQI